MKKVPDFSGDFNMFLCVCSNKIEMICLMYDALTKNATAEEMKEAGLAAHYAQHGREIFMQDANGLPFNVNNFGAMGDCLADLSEDMAAEEKARATYEHLMDLTKDEDVLRVLTFLRERELVHFALFKELFCINTFFSSIFSLIKRHISFNT